MTRDELDAIVAWWRPRLGLQAWEISVRWERDPDDDGEHFEDVPTSRAFTWRARDYEEARVYFNPSQHEDWDRTRANEIAVHELLHLVTREAEYVLDIVDGHLHRDSQELVERAHRHAMEGAVDRLAHRLVELVAELGELPPRERKPRRRRARAKATPV
jgi:hypothetical protein